MTQKAYTQKEIATYARLALSDDPAQKLCGYNWQCCSLVAFLNILSLMLKHGGTFKEASYTGADYDDAEQVFNDIALFIDSGLVQGY